MWCSAAAAQRALALLLAIALLAGAPTVTAESATTHTTVRNAPPDVVDVQANIDPRLGAFHYAVRASDGNGAPDLDRVVFHLLDANDALHVFADPQPTVMHNEAVWTGVAHLGLDTLRGPFRVHLHVYDVRDAEATAEAQATLLSAPLDAVRETRQEVPEADPRDLTHYLPLAETVQPLGPDDLPLLMAVAAALLAIVGFAAYGTAARSPRTGAGRTTASRRHKQDDSTGTRSIVRQGPSATRLTGDAQRRSGP